MDSALNATLEALTRGHHRPRMMGIFNFTDREFVLPAPTPRGWFTAFRLPAAPLVVTAIGFSLERFYPALLSVREIPAPGGLIAGRRCEACVNR